jgi:hypothetical protein
MGATEFVHFAVEFTGRRTSAIGLRVEKGQSATVTPAQRDAVDDELVMEFRMLAYGTLPE